MNSFKRITVIIIWLKLIKYFKTKWWRIKTNKSIKNKSQAWSDKDDLTSREYWLMKYQTDSLASMIYTHA